MIKLKTIFILLVVLIILNGCKNNTMDMQSNVNKTKNQETTEGKQYIESEMEYFLYEEVEGGIEITGYEMAMHQANYISIPKEIDGKMVISIGESSFSNDKIRAVNVPGNIKSIGDEAFAYCYELEKVIIEEGVEKIGEGVFDSCESLTEIKLPSSIKSVGYATFIFASNLKDIELNSNIEIIDNCVFCGTAIESYVVPEGITEIRFEAFADCVNLKDVYIPASVKLIDEYAFKNIESDITIKCEAGSYAEEFANQYGIKVEVQ